MNIDIAQALAEAQDLIYGGAISLTTAVVLLLLQTLLQRRHERYLERRATRERFFAYDLDKLRKLEVLVAEFRQGAHLGDDANEDVFERILELLITSTSSRKSLEKMFKALGETAVIGARLAKAHKDILRENPTATRYDMLGDDRFSGPESELQLYTAALIKTFRVEVLSEEPTRNTSMWPSRLRGRGGVG